MVLGPGSLYTSVLPVLLIPQIRDAVAAAPGLRIYACNVATQRGETQGLDLADHVEALIGHTRERLIDVVLANDELGVRARQDTTAEPVRLRWPPSVDPVPMLFTDDVVAGPNAHHHDPVRLAAAILRVFEREAGRHRRAGVARSA